MIWALGMDDHNGLSCHNGSFPLILTISRCLSQDEDTTKIGGYTTLSKMFAAVRKLIEGLLPLFHSF